MNMQVNTGTFTQDTLSKIATYAKDKYPELRDSPEDLSRFLDAVVEFGLDPRRGHLYPHYSWPDGVRHMEPTTTNQGMRVKAERSGLYLPDDREPIVETDLGIKGDDNPHGIVRAIVRVKKFVQGEWHIVTGVAYFRDFAHLSRKSNWQRQPFNMMITRAEAQALRRAFPDLLSIYTRDEMEDFEGDRDRRITREPVYDETPGVKQLASKLTKPKNDTFVDWKDGKGLTPIRLDDFGEMAEQWLAAHEQEPERIIEWRDDRVNQEARKLWWERHKKTERAKRIVAMLSKAVDSVNERKAKKQAEPA